VSELTLTVIRLGLLGLLWVFVFSVVGVLRGDLYGTRVSPRAPRSRVSRREARAANAYSEQSGASSPAGQSRDRSASRIPTTVTLTAGPLAGTSIPLQDSGILIGRNPECTLVLDDDFASGNHARIYRSPQGWVVEDLGSTNGTFTGRGDTTRITEPLPLEVGSTLRIGQTVLELR